MEHFIELNGIRLCYEREGSGYPLLMIPGLGAGAWLWSRNVDAFTPHFDVIVPELRGSGRSDKPDHRYTIAALGEDIKLLIRELDLQNLSIIGASMGGFVALYLAAKLPRVVRKLVMVGTPLGGDEQIGPDGEVLTQIIVPRGRSRRERLEAGYLLNFSDDFIRTHSGELEKITEQRIQHPQPQFAYYRQLLAGNAFDGRPYTCKIKIPTLICAGREDPLVPYQDILALRDSLPTAHLETFEGKHLFFYENSDRFNRTVLDFLNRVN